jgi:molybdate transport system substrate-binding protein
MKMLSRALVAAISTAVLVLAPGAGLQAAEVQVVATGALSGAFKEIVSQFESTSGHKVSVKYAASPVVIKQTQRSRDSSRPASAPSSPLSPLESPCVLARRSRIWARPTHLPDSVNGKHFISVFERLGTGEDMKAKFKAQKEPAQVAEAVAKGETEIALLVSNLLIGVPGVDFAGLVPAEFQQTLVFTAAVGAKAREPQAASAFIKHLGTPAALAVIKANGMEIP